MHGYYRSFEVCAFDHPEDPLRLYVEPSDERYKITVIMHYGKLVTLEVKASDTIERVKAKIPGFESVPGDHFVLKEEGEELEDGHTLWDYRIFKGAFVSVGVRRGVQIFVKVEGIETPMLVLPCDTIDNVQAMVATLFTNKIIPVDQQRLIIERTGFSPRRERSRSPRR